MRLHYLLLLALSAWVGISAPAWAADGTYTSSPIGDERLVSFQTFAVHNQAIPSGTSITYAFAGSATNYERWSAPQAVAASLPLTSISELANSKYVKVRIVLSASGGVTPTVGGFSVSYDVLGSAPVSPPTATASTVAWGQSAATSQVSTTVNLSNSSQVTTTPAALASTGGNLWLNLGIALVLSVLTGWWLVGRRAKAPSAPATPAPPLA